MQDAAFRVRSGGQKGAVRVRFDGSLKFEFHGSKVTSDELREARYAATLRATRRENVRAAPSGHSICRLEGWRSRVQVPPGAALRGGYGGFNREVKAKPRCEPGGLEYLAHKGLGTNDAHVALPLLGGLVRNH